MALGASRVPAIIMAEEPVIALPYRGVTVAGGNASNVGA